MKKSKLYTFTVIFILLIGVTQSVLSNPIPLGVVNVYWMDQLLARVNYEGYPLITELNIDTVGSTKLAAYGITIKYDNSDLILDKNFVLDGVEAGPGGFVTAVNPDINGEVKITGFDVYGKTDMILFKVHWEINSVLLYRGGGNIYIDMEVNDFVDEKTNDIPYVVNRETATIIAGKMPGDVDGNDVTDIIDALLVAKYYTGIIDPDFNTEAADVNCDGAIDIVDALLIAQYYVGLIQSLDCP